jgi:hypothetical protein
MKVIPANIGDLLTPIALAYWLAGEAHYHQRDGVITIATNSFTAVEVDQLRATLLNNFNIESSRNSAGVKGKEQYRIRRPKREVPKVQALVKAHIPESMGYRVLL